MMAILAGAPLALAAESPIPGMPESDPAIQGAAPKLLPAIAGKHPRLLMTAADLPRLTAFYTSVEGRPWRESLEKYLPSCSAPTDTKFLKNATDGQRQGLWKLPTVALHYRLTGDKQSFQRTVDFLEFLADQPHWESAPELDSGMSSANVMIGFALALDWLHDDLEATQRAKFRAKLREMARRQYYGGHLKMNPGTHYWQNDGQNNHRWHRNAGLSLAAVAIYENAPEDQWLLQKLVEELEFIVKWLPTDGTSHESPSYMVFGGSHLVLSLQAADDCLGTKFLQEPFFKTNGRFQTGTLLPGFSAAFGFGDWDGNGIGHYANYQLKLAALHKQPDLRDAVLRMYEKTPSSMAYTWFNFLWDDPKLGRGDATKAPLSMFWEDLGLAVVRESWTEGVAAMYKCGPFGGYRLNEFRNEHNGQYINVAHDDPDANSFVLAHGTEFLAETDRYAKKKLSAGHNTILINGMGQMVEGRGEGLGFTQPGGDMSKMAVVTAWRSTPEISVMEGEAAGSYLAYTDKKSGKGRPALDRYRRTFVWVKGAYLLVLDDIRAPENVDVSWLIQGPNLVAKDQATGQFELASKSHQCPFQVVASAPLEFGIADSPAESRGKPLGFKQLTASFQGRELLVASLYNPWNLPALSVRLERSAGGEAVILVEGGGLQDAWSWKAAPAQFTASTLQAARRKGPAAGFPFSMDPGNSAPRP